MSRVDRPALKCDRCSVVTEDTSLMGRFMTLAHSHMSGTTTWDLCPACAAAFRAFIKDEK